MRNKPIWIYLAGVAAGLLLFSLIGGGNLCAVLCLLWLIVTLVYVNIRMIKAIRGHQGGRQVILWITRIIAVILIGCSLQGINTAHSRSRNGRTYQSIQAEEQLANSFGEIIEWKDLKDEYGLMAVGYIFAANRIAYLLVGLVLLGAPFGWALYKKSTGQMSGGMQATANGQQPMNPPRAPIQTQQLVQSAQQGLQNMKSSLHSAHQQFRAVQQYAQQAVQQPGGLIRDDRCCICGGRFRNGFAVLFTLPDGKEARIDEDCWNRINTVHNGMDPMQISQINSYFYGRLNTVDSTVVPYLQGYIQTGNQRLAQGLQNQPEQM